MEASAPGNSEFLSLWTNNGVQALIGACFCHWLLCLCLCINIGLLCCKQIKGKDCYLSPAQRSLARVHKYTKKGELETMMSKAHNTGFRQKRAPLPLRVPDDLSGLSGNSRAADKESMGVYFCTCHSDVIIVPHATHLTGPLLRMPL